MIYSVKPIGIIITNHLQKEGTPIQPSFAKDENGVAEVFDEFAEGLKDLDGFSHAILIYYFDRHNDYNLVVKPYLDEEYHGVFATRAPKRPNQIGFSIVKIINISDGTIEFLGADMLNETPLLDIKPYVAEFDHPGDVRNGWMHNKLNIKNKNADNRF